MPLVCLRLMTCSADSTPFSQMKTRAPDRIDRANVLSWLLRIPALGAQPSGNSKPGIGAKSRLPNSRAPGKRVGSPNSECRLPSTTAKRSLRIFRPQQAADFFERLVDGHALAAMFQRTILGIDIVDEVSDFGE